MTKLHKAAEQALRYLVRSRPSALDNFDEMAERHYVIEDLQEALAQQGEPVAWMVTTEKQDGTRETYPMTGRYKDVKDVCDFGEPIPLYAAAAPAAQHGGQPPYQCPGKSGDDPRGCGRVRCQLGGKCVDAAAPAVQPDTWTDDGGWTFPIEKPIKE